MAERMGRKVGLEVVVGSTLAFAALARSLAVRIVEIHLEQLVSEGNCTVSAF